MLIPVGILGLSGRLSTGRWLTIELLILGPAWGLVLLIGRLNRTAVWRARFRRLLNAIPGFGAAARHRRRATFATVFEAAYGAGIAMDRCLDLAGRAADLPEAAAVAGSVAAGDQLAPTLARTGVLSTSALSRIATGEHAGELSGALKAIAADESQEAEAVFRRTMVTVGKLIYVAVAACIAVYALTVFSRFYGQ